MEEQEKTFKSVIEKYSVPCLCETLQVFQRVDLSEFAPENLSNILSNQLLKWRIGKRQSSELQWEPSCLFQEASISQVIEWNCITNCREPTPTQKELQNMLKACCPEHYWCYADYMHMKDVFLGPTGMLNKLKWQELGFTDKTGYDSTLWIGTAGAHTLCHYDTYGYNIVLQISGTKRWVLFPPSDTDLLYPTRVPYEESTVFSRVNLGNPDLSHHPRFREASACTVILRPGDILYVPRHWWHYVENLELSVSINLWCDMDSDAEDRLNESVTRYYLGAMAHMLPKEEAWINPTESITSLTNIKESWEFISKSLQETSPLARLHLPPDENNIQQIFHHGSNPILIKPMNMVNFMENTYYKFISSTVKDSKCQISSKRNTNEPNAVTAMRCLTHPKVIERLSMVFKEELKNNACDLAYIADALSSHGSTSTWTDTSRPSINSFSVSNYSSEISKDAESSVDEPCTLQERSSSTPGASPSLDDRELTRTPIGHEYSSGEADIRSKNVKDTGMHVEFRMPTAQVILGHRINHSAVNQFPLTTISGVRDFEKQLKEGDSALVDMMKYNDASSLEAYFDYVIPKLLAYNLLSQYKTTPRAEGAFCFSDEVFHAMQEALQGNATLKNSNDSLISRCLRIWVSTQQRKFRDSEQKLLKRHCKQGLVTQAKRSNIRTTMGAIMLISRSINQSSH